MPLYLIALFLFGLLWAILWRAKWQANYERARTSTRGILYAAGTVFILGTCWAFFGQLNDTLAQIIIWSGWVAALVAGMTIGGQVQKSFSGKRA